METAVYLAVVLPLALITALLAKRRHKNFWIYFVSCALVPIVAIAAIPYLLSSRSIHR